MLSNQFWYWMYGMLPPLPQWMAVCQAEGFDVNHAGIEGGVSFEERADRLRRDLAATGEGDVRMERAQIRLEPGGEDSFLDAFV